MQTYADIPMFLRFNDAWINLSAIDIIETISKDPLTMIVHIGDNQIPVSDHAAIRLRAVLCFLDEISDRAIVGKFCRLTKNKPPEHDPENKDQNGKEKEIEGLNEDCSNFLSA